jgi:hypothetical protein
VQYQPSPSAKSTRPFGLVSDLGLRGMIEAWFELERMKSNLVPGPDTARMLKRCEVRIRGAIMHLWERDSYRESMAAADRSGGSEAVRALWMEAVAQGKAEKPRPSDPSTASPFPTGNWPITQIQEAIASYPRIE